MKPKSVTYDPEAQVVYLIFQDVEHVDTVEISPEVYLELASDGSVVALEVSNVPNDKDLHKLSIPIEETGEHITREIDTLLGITDADKHD